MRGSRFGWLRVKLVASTLQLGGLFYWGCSGCTSGQSVECAHAGQIGAGEAQADEPVANTAWRTATLCRRQRHGACGNIRRRHTDGERSGQASR
jgi:hypothetical protein